MTLPLPTPGERCVVYQRVRKMPPPPFEATVVRVSGGHCWVRVDGDRDAMVNLAACRPVRATPSTDRRFQQCA